ncbi:14455_t:CDS:2 [Funneliformis geosporum]|uniref:19762_t:CDS:1 n=1 Tax=Funneliformis geosporum TaxID=1117311 RepID=A0A9W4SW32_9GLOM|nr:19762_t:CDS:2 [Funneliformis geosporum]CAI2181244.1 14455_t:CDS:2 [Funneliformis geosporum]
MTKNNLEYQVFTPSLYSSKEENNHNSSSITRNESRKLKRIQLKKLQAYEVIEKIENAPWKKIFSLEHTQYLCLTNVCFGGIGGVTTEQLSNIFKSFNGYLGLKLTHGKPYSFIIFNTPYDAFHAREALHEKSCDALNGKIMFIEYVNLNYQNFIKQIKNSDKRDIPGLILMEEFITIEQEKEILQVIYSTKSWIPVQDRMVVFGIKLAEFPFYMNSLLEKLRNLFPSIPKLEQLTIQIYPIGTGIPPHMDSHSSFGPSVIAFSLESSVIMEFKNIKTNKVVNIDLPRRSLMIIKDETRYAWSHAIRARKSDTLENGQIRDRGQRISLTLRTVNPDRICKCSWPELCDRNVNHFGSNIETGES